MRLLDKMGMIDFIRTHSPLFDAAGQVNPFSCSEWMLHFVEQIAETGWSFVVPEYHVGGLSLMLLYGTTASAVRTQSVNNYYASLYSVLLSSVTDSLDRCRSIQALVGELAGLGRRTSILEFSPLDAHSEDTINLRRYLSEGGWYVRQYACFGNWYLPCAGLRFDDYMQARDTRLLNTWKRKRKRFDMGTDGARLEIVTDPEQVPAAMDAFERVYAKSWKRPEPYPDFVRRWAAICAERGWLRLGLAWAGDVPIAAQLWFTMHGRAYIFKLAYDEAYAKWSAGTVLSAHLFRQALDQDHVREIDYLTGDDDYKKSWMSERRERIGFIACNPRTMHGLWRATREFAGYATHRLRQRAKSMRR
ncbi:MAG: GNAT family N-acetyltransferase [Propionivibrio sp.]